MNVGIPKYIKKILSDIKGEIYSKTITVGDLNTPLMSMDNSSRQKVNAETLTINDTLDLLDLVNICRIFHPKAIECTFLSSEHGTFSRIYLSHARLQNMPLKL